MKIIRIAAFVVLALSVVYLVIVHVFLNQVIGKDDFLAIAGIVMGFLGILTTKDTKDTSNESISNVKSFVNRLEFRFSGGRIAGFDGIVELNTNLPSENSQDFRIHDDEIRRGYSLIENNYYQLTELFNELIEQVEHNSDSRSIIAYLKNSRERAIPRLANGIYHYLGRHFEGEELILSGDSMYELKKLAKKLKDKLR